MILGPRLFQARGEKHCTFEAEGEERFSVQASCSERGEKYCAFEAEREEEL